MRPSGETAVASRIIMPAPESARCPRWIMCQSVAEPPSAEYWHIGAMTMRLDNVSLQRVIGSNKRLMAVPHRLAPMAGGLGRGWLLSDGQALSEKSAAARCHAEQHKGYRPKMLHPRLLVNITQRPKTDTHLPCPTRVPE